VSQRVSFVLVFFLAIGVALSCSRNKESMPLAHPSGDGDPSAKDDALDDGLTLRVREVEASDDKVDPVPLADAEKLGAADIASVLARVPALPKEPGDAKPFAKRSESMPAPTTGIVDADAFPPKKSGTGKPKVAKTKLHVVRFAPEGDVPIAPHLSITFDQPMVPITSHAELAAKDPPVKLTPTPKGEWRWVGTKTLMFSPAERFPMATRYEVEVKAGATATTGAKLAKAHKFTFTTPSPKLVNKYPADISAKRHPLVFLELDQQVDAKAVLPKIELRVGRKKHALRLATKAEIEKEEEIEGFVANAQPGRFVVVRPTEVLPGDRKVEVTLAKGTPSAEGPRATAEPQEFHFQTYGPLEIKDHGCGWRGECPPGTPFMIEFTNPIDVEHFDESMVRVDPELPNRNIQVYGTQMHIYGQGKGRTRYDVTLSASLPDTFGQTLREDETVSFRVTKAPEQLFVPGGPLTTLDPSGGTNLRVMSVNYKKLDVQVWAVQPDDWPAYLEFLRKQYEERKPKPPGKRVFSGKVDANGERDEIGETPIDLKSALRGGLGHAIVIVEADTALTDPQRVFTWVQATKLGLDAFVDATDAVAWATDLATGAPVRDVEIDLVTGGKPVRTDANGVARLALPKTGSARLIRARKGNDIAFLPEQTFWWGGEAGWQARKPGDALTWFVFDDRGVYKPGETVRFKGWLRRTEMKKGGDIRSAEASEIKWVLRDSRGAEVRKGSLRASKLGAFDGEIALPDNANLGDAMLQLTASKWPSTEPGRDFYHSFQIREFRRPEYEVTVEASEGPHRVGGTALLTAEAKYYAGGGLGNADVHWQVIATEATFVPPNRSDYLFGRYRPWWMWWGPGVPMKEPKIHTLQAKTDGGGKHRIATDFVAADPPLPHSVSAEAVIHDVNRQAWAASSTLLVHPADVYVGIKSARAFVDAGQPIELDGIVVDLDGKAIEGRAVQVETVRLTWTQKGVEQVEVENDKRTCKAKSKADGFACSIATKKGGLHRLRAYVTDAKGNRNLTELQMWVAGGEIPQDRGLQQERVTLIPDRDAYAQGDTAKLLVVAPFANAHGVLTLRRSGLEEVRPFAIEGSSHTLEIPVDARYTPMVHVQVDLVGAAPRRDDSGKIDTKLPKRPAYATGIYELKVPPKDRTLAVKAEPREAKLEPGARTHVDVTLTDHAGKPVEGGDVAIVIVDEAVLALSDKTTPDPLTAFYGYRMPDVVDVHSRAAVQLATGKELENQYRVEGVTLSGGAPGGPARDFDAVAGVATSADRIETKSRRGRMRHAEEPAAPPPSVMPKPEPTSGKKGGQDAPIALRSNFDALAVFEADARTNAEGRTTVEVKLPDNLTRYRVMAIAASGDHDFGSGEATITARLPLMVRPSPPRFLNFGDRFELPIVVQNQTDDPLTVSVAVRAANLELTEGQGRRFVVPANDRREVRLPAETESAGTARLQIGAAAGTFADAAQVELPVWTPATTEAFATYGEIDKGAIAHAVTAPRGVFTEFGGLEITTSSTAVSALTDAVLYLVDYPFECNEQIASRLLAIAALRDVLGAFAAEGLPPPKQLEAAVRRDIDTLARRQHDDGGMGFWRRDSEAWPYLGVHVAHAFARAQSEGFKVPAEAMARSKRYLGDIERKIPRFYGDAARRTIEAYALHVRHVLGDDDLGKAKKLLRGTTLEELPLEAQGFILPILAKGKASKEVAEIERFLDNKVTETAAAAHFADGYADDAHVVLHSNRRADGILLEAFVEMRPKSDLVPKLVRGLLSHRKAGRWTNTQENTFVLLALNAYFDRFEKTTPDFVAKAWLGDRYAGEHAFEGRTTEKHLIDVPMALVGDPGTKQQLVLAKNGKGRLYYRVGMKYAPSDLEMPPADHGFEVTRIYEAIDDPKDVRRNDKGGWSIKAGARVRVRVTMVAPARRYHVALVDPLPAGLEPIDPALAVSGSIPNDPEEAKKRGAFWWWWGTWYEHQSLRDERAEAFASMLWEGVHEYSYVARATTPGEFVVPPAKAEEMYNPETFGRSAVDRVVVE
jgi:uncharacterized protein YfaS (alpha-2-macroglobulin family)